MKRKLVIPKPPLPETITEEVEKRRNEWIAYFRNLSPRLNVITRSNFPSEGEYNNFLENTNFFCQEIIRVRDDVDEPEIFDWPKKESIVFIVEINSSLEPNYSKINSRNTYVFCYGDTAFGLAHFDREDCYELGCELIYRYSLSNYPRTALSWSYISFIIKGKLEEIENSVPPFKKWKQKK